jgi:putative membrane protein
MLEIISVQNLPVINATLNAVSAVLLSAGYWFIRRNEIRPHRLCMLGAFSVSCLFLASYLVYHYHVGSVPFTAEGWIRTVYFIILITHIVLAAVILPLALITLSNALKEKFDRHRKIARWTFPLWLYVSVTGIVVYWMLYQM